MKSAAGRFEMKRALTNSMYIGVQGEREMRKVEAVNKKWMEEEKRKTHAIIKYQPISNSQIPKPTFMDLPVCYLSVMLSNRLLIFMTLYGIYQICTYCHIWCVREFYYLVSSLLAYWDQWERLVSAWHGDVTRSWKTFNLDFFADPGRHYPAVINFLMDSISTKPFWNLTRLWKNTRISLHFQVAPRD